MSFEEMLDQVYELLDENIKEKIDLQIPEPVLIRSGNNNIWKNIKEFLKITNKPPDHLMHFLNVELSNVVTWISDKKSDGVIIKEKIKPEKIINLMKKYIVEYVICKSCKTNNIEITKDNKIRTYLLKCNNCFQETFL